MHMTGNQLTGRYMLWNSVNITGDNSNFEFFMALTVNSNFPPPVTTYFCTQTVNIAVRFDWKVVELCKSVENKRDVQSSNMA